MSSRNSKNIWSANEIAPLEFCSLSRAVKLLKCEIEDLFHWHDIGAITLCIRLADTKGILITKINNKNDDIFKLYTENIVTLNELSRVKKAWSRHSKIFGVLKPSEGILKTKIEEKNSITSYETPVFASGVWAITSRNLFDFIDSNEDCYESILSVSSPSSQVLSCLFKPDENQNINISTKNIVITKDTIEKIHSHAINGKPMPLIEDNESQDNNKQDKEKISPQKEKLSEFIRFLIKTNPSISKNILNTTANNRHKLFKEYLDSLKKKGVEVDYDIPSSPTLERYLKL